MQYRSISREEYRSALVAAQVPPDGIELIPHLFGTVLGGPNSRPADGVQQALGRPARYFTDYAAENGGKRCLGKCWSWPWP